ncbi:hypothetical protein BABINDRAFT_24458, partial [Babjeviella inositovora NRRL Y-12698]
KPSLAQFQVAIFNTLLLSSLVYLTANLAWLYLDKQEVEQELIQDMARLEQEFKTVLDEKKAEHKDE